MMHRIRRYGTEVTNAIHHPKITATAANPVPSFKGSSERDGLDKEKSEQKISNSQIIVNAKKKPLLMLRFGMCLYLPDKRGDNMNQAGTTTKIRTVTV